MTQKIVYINGRFLSQPVTGVQRYSRELLGTLDEMISTGEIDLDKPPINLSGATKPCILSTMEAYPGSAGRAHEW